MSLSVVTPHSTVDLGLLNGINVNTPHSVVGLGSFNGLPGINVVAGSHGQSHGQLTLGQRPQAPQDPQLIQGITPDALIQILSILNIAKPNPGNPGKIRMLKFFVKKLVKLKGHLHCIARM